MRACHANVFVGKTAHAGRVRRVSAGQVRHQFTQKRSKAASRARARRSGVLNVRSEGCESNSRAG
jgi:hypothetical protein